MAFREYEYPGGLRVKLKDPEAVTLKELEDAIPPTEVAGRREATVNARDCVAKELLDLVQHCPALKKLTILTADSDEHERWLVEVDPGWTTGSAITVGIGATVAALGVGGYVQANSVPSLVSGVSLGGTLLLCGVAVRSGRRPRTAHLIAAAASTLLVASMGPNAWRKRSLYPGGAIAIASAAHAAHHVTKLFP